MRGRRSLVERAPCASPRPLHAVHERHDEMTRQKMQKEKDESNRMNEQKGEETSRQRRQSKSDHTRAMSDVRA
ncbi:hypothetical protein B0H12DRAFT_1154042, partial [Mycena haematopus]